MVDPVLLWLLGVFVISLVVGGALEMGSYIRGLEVEEKHTK
jgi:hypothetical protein